MPFNSVTASEYNINLPKWRENPPSPPSVCVVPSYKERRGFLIKYVPYKLKSVKEN